MLSSSQYIVFGLVVVFTTLYTVSHGLTRVAIMLWAYTYSCALRYNKDPVILITHVYSDRWTMLHEYNYYT